MVVSYKLLKKGMSQLHCHFCHYCHCLFVIKNFRLLSIAFAMAAILLTSLNSPVVYAGLTPEETRAIYDDPWTFLRNYFDDFRQFHTDALYQIKGLKGFNQQVTTTTVIIPDDEPVNVKEKKLSKFESVEIYENARGLAIRGPDAKFVTMFVVLYFEDGTQMTGLPKAYKQYNPEKLSETMAYFATATRSDVDLSRMHRYTDASGKRWVNDFSRLVNPRSEGTLYQEFIRGMKPAFFRLMADYINQSDALRKKAAKGITVICLGCGEGDELNTGSTILGEHFQKIKVVGVEKNPDMLAAAKKSFPDYLIVQGDALEAEHHIENSLSASGYPEGVVVVVAIGLLCESALPGTYIAHQILQRIARTNEVDAIFEACYPAKLFNHKSAFRAGWKVTRNLIDYKEIYGKLARLFYLPKSLMCCVVQILTPLPVDQIIGDVISKSDERNSHPADRFTTLDLSFTTQPELLFATLVQRPECKKIKTVDVSWTAIPEKKVLDFFSVIIAFGIKNLIFSGFEPWNAGRVAKVLETPPLNLYKRIDSQYPEELPSVPYALLKQFAPKVSIIMKCKPKDETVYTSRQKEGKVSNLPEDKRVRYLKNLLRLLASKNIQLHNTPRDGMCLYHALSHTMSSSAIDVQALILDTALNQSQHLINELGFSETTVHEIATNLAFDSWLEGNYSHIAVAAVALNQNILLILPNSDTGMLQYHFFTPDGVGGHYQILPYGFDMSNTLILIQNGQDHYVAGTLSELDEYQLSSVNAQVLADHNPFVLNPEEPVSDRVNQTETADLTIPSYNPVFFSW